MKTKKILRVTVWVEHDAGKVRNTDLTGAVRDYLAGMTVAESPEQYVSKVTASVLEA
jgi:hypothetical protein